MLREQEQIAQEQEEKVLIEAENGTCRVPTVNGEGDGTGYSSGLLQVIFLNTHPFA